jgi:hypothetical protein
MKKRWLKILLYSIAALSAVCAGVFLWADNELNKVLGSSTDVIDIRSIVKTSGTVQIKNINILSEDCTHFIENQDIILKNGLILQLGKDLYCDSTFTVIDGTGKYLIPGLTDSHVHLKESKNDLFLYLANGITFVREMAGRPITLEWRRSMQRDGIGPRMFISSPPLFSESGLTGYYYRWTRQAINYSKRDDAEKTIREIKDQGYDAVKMYGFVSPEMFRTTTDIAAKYNIPVIGHIPMVSLEAFYESGQKEIAHVEELVVKTIADFAKPISKNQVEYLDYLKARSKQIAIKLKKNNISVTSTVSLVESFPRQRFDLKSELKAIELKYANPKIIEGTPLYRLGWLPGKNGYEYDGSDDVKAKELSMIFWNTYVAATHIMTKELVDNGVNIMAGTDANVATIVPGFSLHNELQSLSHAGMTNAQALYSATVAPGDWMKSYTGKIKQGYASDLVFLSKNPLIAIGNLKSIEYVFFGKYMIDKGRINTILKAVEVANNRSRSVKIDEYTK